MLLSSDGPAMSWRITANSDTTYTAYAIECQEGSEGERKREKETERPTLAKHQSWCVPQGAVPFRKTALQYLFN